LSSIADESLHLNETPRCANNRHWYLQHEACRQQPLRPIPRLTVERLFAKLEELGFADLRDSGLAEITVRGRVSTSSPMQTLMFSYAAQHSSSVINDSDLRDLVNASNAKFLLVQEGRVSISGDPARLSLKTELELGSEPALLDNALFIVFFEGGPLFSVTLSEGIESGSVFETRRAEGRVGLFQTGMRLSPAEAQLAAKACHLSSWVQQNRYCSRCGSKMCIDQGTPKLRCIDAACGNEQFPRINPAVQVLVVFGERCLLARQSTFPPRCYSPITGFVDAAETAESAVRREVREELGLEVMETRYVTSQPWPFSSSLMLGYVALVNSDCGHLNESELESVVWLGRPELAKAREASSIDSVLLQPVGLLGRSLVDAWSMT
jgi:NAD+ diphosphatase